MSLLLKIHELKSHFKIGAEISEIIDLFALKIKCNVYLADSNGNVIYSNVGTNLTLKPEFSQRISSVFDTLPDFPLTDSFLKESEKIRSHTFMTIIPVRNSKSIIWHLLVTKKGKRFSKEQLILAKFLSLQISIYLFENNPIKSTPTKQHEIDTVLGSLSFSEMKVIGIIFKEINDMNGYLVVNNIDDRMNVPRSVFANAMQKLVAAGVITYRSLGTKGTYIVIINSTILEAIKKMCS
jgi:GTP-sensing pleiotropic transcriptional regulator CodY